MTKSDKCGATGRQFSRLRLLVLVMLAVLGLTPSTARADSAATGLLPPTAEEQAWMDANLIQIEQALPNRLAIDRTAAEQGAGGMKLSKSALDAVPAAPEGAEFRGRTLNEIRATKQTRLAAGDPVVMAYPSALDNSAETWFPPIGNQGSIGSCASFSTTYYTMTSQVARLRGWNVKTDSAGAGKFSTRFVYNQINNGVDGGSWITTAYALMKTNGAPTLQSLPYTSDYKSWPTSSAIWREAINYRMADNGSIVNIDTDAGLANVKQMLANGYILNYATDIYQWKYADLKDDPSTTGDDAIFAAAVPLTRRKVVTHLDSSAGSSGHGMTIVGYNDEVWVDLNNNGVVDPGEKGAFRIANSWGTSWQDGGYVWVSYDALKTTSAVIGGPNPATRVPAFWYKTVYWMSARASYTPTLVAEITASHAKRNQMSLKIGKGTTSSATPTSTWTPSALQYSGGALAFDGTTTAVQATFVIDATDLVNGTAGGQRWFVSLADNNAADAPGTYQNLRFITNDNTITNFSGANPSGVLPRTVDGSTLYAYADNVFTQAVAPAITSQPASAATEEGTTATFSVTATGTATLTYQWKKNGTLINGASLSSYTTPLTTLSDNAAAFTVVVTNSAGTATSSPAVLTINPRPIATVSISGSGSGTVNSNPASITCATGNCSASFTSGTQLSLYATASADSIFSGWSGDCAGGGTCQLSMTSNRSGTATFDLIPKARVNSAPYGSLGSAYAAISPGGDIQSQSLTFYENLTLDRGVDCLLHGGYTDDFLSQAGYTILDGNLTIITGNITIDRLVLQ